jgi:hypothetical protein
MFKEILHNIVLSRVIADYLKDTGANKIIVLNSTKHLQGLVHFISKDSCVRVF